MTRLAPGPGPAVSGPARPVGRVPVVDRVRGLVACLALAGILVGLPWTLLALGPRALGGQTRVPGLRVPSVGDVEGFLAGLVDLLTRPDDGTAAVALVMVAGWVAWVVLAGAILLEILARVRGARVPRIPGFGAPQAAARSLVATAVLLFVAAPLTVTTASAADAVPGPTTGVTAPAAATSGEGVRGATTQRTDLATASPAAGAATPPTALAAPASPERATTSEPAQPPVMHTVVSGESLWSIAATRLGDPLRYQELAALNADVLGGRPDFLTPGMVLRLPTPPTPATPAATAVTEGSPAPPVTEHVVAAGDTLSSIAEQHLGDPGRWPEIFEASTGTVQPGGTRLSDPDVIDIGWRLTLPPAPADTTTAGSPDPATDPDPITGPQPNAEPDPQPPSSEDSPAPTAQGRLAPPQPAGPTAEGRPEPGNAAESRPRDPDAPPAASGPVGRQGADDSDTTTRAENPGNEDAGVDDAELEDAEQEDAEQEDAGDVVPGWLVTGLAGGGAVLAGSLLLDLRRRRRTQARSRLPGRAVPVPGPELAPVDRTAHAVGGISGATVEVLDDVLRRLATSCVRAGREVPPVAAVQVDPDVITLHLTAATALPDPWVNAAEQRVWRVGRAAADRVGPRDPDQPAPYPLLVTLGTDHTGSTWLLNLEDQTLHLTGPAGPPAPATRSPTAPSSGSPTDRDADDRGGDLARYWAAEIACHPWAAGVEVSCAGIAGETAPMAPDRVRVLGPDHPDPVAQVLTGALATLDRLSQEATAGGGSHAAAGAVGTVAAARAAGLGADTWPARALLLDVTSTREPLAEAPVEAPARDAPGTLAPERRSGAAGSGPLGELLRLVEAHAGRTGTTVVVLGDPPDRTRLRLHVSAEGRARLDPPGLEVSAVGLSAQEAAGCAALLAQSEDTTPVPIPETPLPAALGDDPEPTPKASDRVPGDAGWRSWANEAGGLRVEHTLPRHPPPDQARDEARGEAGEPVTSVLSDPDAAYLVPAATTAEDLAVLAPRVPARVATAVEDADAALDADVAAWFDPACDRPRLTLLGPVGARTRGSAVVVAKRKAFYTEVLAYLATRPHGATPAELAEDLGISPAAARNAVHIVREWLGTDPRTGARHLPDAREAPAAVARGVPAYQVVGLLVDADLFRRLRVRGQARGGEAGMADLLRALTLVTGRPLDRLRPGGWGWVLDGDRLDQHLVCAVVDVAHLVTTHHLRTGDLTRARHAAEVAALAGPYEEIPRLDLAAVAEAEGHHHLARRIARDEIANRSDDHGPPPELSARTERLLRDHGWLTPHDRRETT